ncbi:STE family protein kinase [Tritrichomonas foetus]|uniref:non-specific serine/threonine protein kinase n=1 Tax=Tritrichomonas foetus TaxID=1144522 RepID=A0A1J4KEE3_9EUKA|nr:STE family protein kinase [Tritrichomonas foetus]|eukprot:OHT07990.1 STE family protein kinase [Tritrichomonas foetus]
MKGKKKVKKVVKKRASANITGPLEVSHPVHLDSDKTWKFDKNTKPEEIFQVIKVIGEGGFGTVVQLFHTPSSQFMAGKNVHEKLLLSEKNKKMLKDEIKLMRSINSHYTIQYYGTVLLNGNMTILMEYCKQGSFRDLLDFRNEVLSEDQISIVMSDLINALLVLQKHRIVHRDIKAANILLSQNGYCRVTDFGISRQFEENQTFTMTSVGTPYWMAPEAINNQMYSYPVDIWGMACTAVELAEGAPPYCELEPVQAMQKISMKGFPPMRYEEHFSEDFKDFVYSCGKMNPSDRPTLSALTQHPFIKRTEKLDRAKVLEPLMKTQMDFKKLKELLEENCLDDGDDGFASRTATMIQESKLKTRHKYEKENAK